MRIAVFATLNRPRALEIVRQVVTWLQAQGHAVRMSEALALASECADCALPDEAVVADAELAISIGGDGTMLSTARAAAPAGVPVLGINAGALGFLTEITPDEIPLYLPRVLGGDYTLEPRMMLHAQAFRGAELLCDMPALNDIVVRQGAKARLINLSIAVAGHALGRMGADGLIIATPSGSTAYGLAAGGPIIHPTASVMELIPICAHSLSFRPMVVPATDPVEVVCEGNQHQDEMMLTADGQEPVTLFTGDRIIVAPAPDHALLVKLGLSSFYDRLREKLQWGGR